MSNLVKTEEYRGYTIKVFEVAKRDPKYDADAVDDAGDRLVAIGKFTVEDAFAHMKRNIDYWEGIEGLEGKTNKELAQIIADDAFRDMASQIQDRFLLEVADRLRNLAEKGPTNQVVPVNTLDISED